MFQADTELWGPATSHPPCTYEVYDMSDATSTKSRIGRPSLYSEALAEKICGLIEQGYSERQIAKMDGMPSLRSIQSWKDANPVFLQRSVRAREVSAELYDDKRREAAKWLMEQAEQAAESGLAIPKGVVEAVKAVMQEHARSAAMRDDSRFGDRKTVKVDATDTAAGMADVYAKMLAAVKDDEDA